MIRKYSTFLLLTIFTVLIQTTHQHNKKCKPTCGNEQFQYPFGFSAGCHIQLNCSATGIPKIGDFSILALNSESIRIKIQRNCTRSLQSLSRLFGKQYAPTFRNAILLHNCNTQVLQCEIPSISVTTSFGSLSCNPSSSISCYSENTTYFMDLESVKRTQCRFVLSSILAVDLKNSKEPVSLDIEVVELGWWLQGDCQFCDKNANCTSVVSPDGKSGYRCSCYKGFVGDGYLGGLACRKAPKCNFVNYLIGRCRGKTRLVVLIGAIASGASFIMMSLGLMCCFVRRQNKLKARHSTKRRLSEATGNCNIPLYHFREIEKATNGFSENQRLGTGAYGTVYAGKLQGDQWVAIKRIKYRDTDNTEQVMNEIKLISSVSHPNLVQLLGCSIDHGEQILVYEFMPNGTLCQHLQRERGEGLDWPIRLTIATHTAQAISYLHFAVKPPIYHRDIKSSNILLDHKFKSKVADFGLSRLGMTEISHISTAPQGTPGYLDPQYHQNFHLSDKSDVYSFGVVLVEIITAMKAVDFTRPPNEVNLAVLATDRIGNGCLDEIIDPFLEPNRDTWTHSSVHKVAELAFRCLAFHRDMRPSMMEVADELEQIRASRLICSEENTYIISSEGSSTSFSSNTSDKPMNVNKEELKRREVVVVPNVEIGSLSSMERLTDDSPVSNQDPWFSEQSSHSSNSLLGNART